MAILEWQPVDLRSDPHELEHRGDPADLIEASAFVAELIRRPAWHDFAACRSGDASFFPGRGEDIRPAKALCASCPVLEECRSYALAHPALQGVWAGMSERERRRRRQQVSTESLHPAA